MGGGRTNILDPKRRIAGDDLLRAQPGGEMVQHHGDRDARALDAGLAVAPGRVDADALTPIPSRCAPCGLRRRRIGHASAGISLGRGRKWCDSRIATQPWWKWRQSTASAWQSNARRLVHRTLSLVRPRSGVLIRNPIPQGLNTF